VRSFLVPLADAGELPTEGEADLRYAGQSFELTLPLQEGNLAEAFHRAHEERYGFSEKDRELELVVVRTAEVRHGPKLELFGSETRAVDGPELLALRGATVWVPDGWAGKTNEHGTLVLSRA
jgi:N-methylhydantoinase A